MGVAQKLGMPYPSQLKIEMGVGGAIFDPHPPNFVKIHIF